MDTNKNTQFTLDNLPLNGPGLADFFEAYNLYTAQPQVKEMLDRAVDSQYQKTLIID